MLAQLICSSFTVALCEKINGMWNVHFPSLLLKWQPEVPRAKVHAWTRLWRVSKQIQSILSSRSFSLWPKCKCNMSCLLMTRERLEILSFPIQSSCRFCKWVNSLGSSGETCPQHSCRIHSCSLKVNHRNVGLEETSASSGSMLWHQAWQMFLTSALQTFQWRLHCLPITEGNFSPTQNSQFSPILTWNLLYCKFLLVLHCQLWRKLA